MRLMQTFFTLSMVLSLFGPHIAARGFPSLEFRAAFLLTEAFMGYFDVRLEELLG